MKLHLENLPPSLAAQRETLAQCLEAMHAAHPLRQVILFGSHARGEARPDSDIDSLVDMERGRSLLDLIELGQDLEELLNHKVDVLTDGGLSPHLEQRIHAEAVPLCIG